MIGSLCYLLYCAFIRRLIRKSLRCMCVYSHRYFHPNKCKQTVLCVLLRPIWWWLLWESIVVYLPCALFIHLHNTIQHLSVLWFICVFAIRNVASRVVIHGVLLLFGFVCLQILFMWVSVMPAETVFKAIVANITFSYFIDVEINCISLI